MLILGIETSCDETAAAVVENGTRVLSNVIASQIPLHQETGGVVPEVAAREHVVKIIPVVEQALREAHLCAPQPHLLSHIDAIAVTQGPGLLSSLVIGVSTASTLALASGKPLIPVNHIAGHIYANWLQDLSLRAEQVNPAEAQRDCFVDLRLPRNDRAAINDGEGFDAKASDHAIEFPCVVLTVSGGHNELIYMRDHVDFQLLGETLDDAAGEAFDKVARLLNLGYPGGPQIARAAQAGNSKRFSFPKSYLHKESYDFSFSGLKTAVLNAVKAEHVQEGQLSQKFVADCAASFQEATCEVLSDKLLRAAQEYDVKTVLLSGGVSANKRLRAMISAKIEAGYFYDLKGKKVPLKRRLNFYFPQDFSFCTDNAAMIAGVAYFMYQKTPNKKIFQNYQVLADPHFGRA